MKNNSIFCIALLVAFMAACNDSYLDKTPETSLTEGGFFQSPEDLKLYSDQFYQQFSFSSWGGMVSPYYAISDVPSDNNYNSTVTSGVYDGTSSSLYDKLSGTFDASRATQWSWTDIRAVNYFLARADKAKGDQALINHYIGLGRLVRAMRYYFSKVLVYGDVPWYDRDLGTTDEGLYKAQDSRDDVVKKIFEDLDFAIDNMQSAAGSGGQDRLYREAALGFAARIALNEGAWRKYHSELNASDANEYYQKAANYAEQLMNSGKYSLYDSYDDYFTLMNLKGNSEAIFYKDYDYSLGEKFNGRSLCDYTTWNLSRDLMEDYLYLKEDGSAVPFNTISGYDKVSFLDFYKNRDPRLSSTFWRPGMKRLGQPNAYPPTFNAGGYVQYKFYPRTLDQNGYCQSYSDLSVIRYGEILLIYAEAKAELGTLAQSDLDKTVNLLRSRVGMPSANLSDWLSDIDYAQEAKYPNVTGAMKGAILEIRRERRVELACEGFRYNDLMRWNCGERFAIRAEGIYLPALGEYDLTGDGKPDRAFVNEADVDKVTSGVDISVVGNVDFELSEGTSGYVISKTVKDAGLTFHSPKDYYSPVSLTEMKLNPNLQQNKYWK